jgi:UrcA family protein
MKIATVFATAILSLTAIGSLAAAPSEVNQVTVHYADLDLDREAGVAALFNRIKGAAKRVCSASYGETLVAKQAYAGCIRKAVSSAVARIDRHNLTEYVAQRSAPPVLGASTRLAAQ